MSRAILMWKDAVQSTLHRYEHSRLTVQGDGFDHLAVNRALQAREEEWRRERDNAIRNRAAETEDADNQSTDVDHGRDHDHYHDEHEDDDDDEVDDEEDEDDDDDSDNGREECYKRKYIMVPEPDPYMRRQRKPDDEDVSNFEWTFSGESLQVIIKLASIHLTPEKPEYGGGSWHVEFSNVYATVSSV
jgi:primase-polymerase (primpol)-like protein